LAGLDFVKFAKARPGRLAEAEEVTQRAIYEAKLKPKGKRNQA